MKNPLFENDYGNGWLEDRILHFVYKPGVAIDINAARKIVDDRSRFTKGIAYPLYSDIRGVKFFDKLARDYFANEGSSCVKCVAFVADSPTSKLIGDFYISINKPVVPTRMFVDKEDVMEYLKNFN